MRGNTGAICTCVRLAGGFFCASIQPLALLVAGGTPGFPRVGAIPLAIARREVKHTTGVQIKKSSFFALESATGTSQEKSGESGRASWDKTQAEGAARVAAGAGARTAAGERGRGAVLAAAAVAFAAAVAVASHKAADLQ